MDGFADTTGARGHQPGKLIPVTPSPNMISRVSFAPKELAANSCQLSDGVKIRNVRCWT
jgi:hypothetical protein